MTDRTRWGLLALVLLLLVGGVVGAAVHEDEGAGPDGLGDQAADMTTSSSTASTASTASSSSSSSSSLTTEAPTTTTTTATAVPPTTELPRGDAQGSGLGSSGTGEIANGTGPTPQTGPPGWIVVAGTLALLMGMTTRRLASA